MREILYDMQLVQMHQSEDMAMMTLLCILAKVAMSAKCEDNCACLRV